MPASEVSKEGGREGGLCVTLICCKVHENFNKLSLSLCVPHVWPFCIQNPIECYSLVCCCMLELNRGQSAIELCFQSSPLESALEPCCRDREAVPRSWIRMYQTIVLSL